jgi:hypothetical protein
MTRLRSKTGYDDWIVYAALFPALLTLVGLGVTAVLAWHAASPSASAIASPIAGDDYVQGLSKHVIVERPAESPPGLGDLLTGP